MINRLTIYVYGIESHTARASKCLFLVALLSTLIMPAHQDSSMSHNEKQRLCGIKLVKGLDVLCRGCFEGGFLQAPETAKRNGLNFRNPFSSPFVSWSKMNEQNRTTVDDAQHWGRLKRVRSGIVEECCIKQCSYNYLKSYCSDACPWLQTSTARTPTA